MATKDDVKWQEKDEAPAIDTSGVELEHWQGPFEEYTYVNTPFGEAGVAAFHVLWYEQKNRVNIQTGATEVIYTPKVVKATDEELAYRGILEAKEYLRPSMDPLRPPSTREAKHHSEIKGVRTQDEGTLTEKGVWPG